MKITDLITDPRSLGDKFWIVDVAPAYECPDNRQTDEITDHRYTACLPEKGLETISIKLIGKQFVGDPEDGVVEDSTVGLEMTLEFINGKPLVGVQAIYGVQAI